MSGPIPVFYVVLLGCGLAGFGLLRSLGLGDREAWGAGRTAGLVAAAFPAWWCGLVGFGRWREVALAVLAAAALWGLIGLFRRPPAWPALVAGEAVFALGFAAVLAIRWGRPDILQTEKLMDMGVLASLLRAGSLPPPDMWFAGDRLHYYDWGALAWVAPISAARLGLDVGFNLTVAGLGGLIAQTTWTLAGRLSGTQGAGLLAAFLATFAGTPDGWRQLVAGHGFAGVDLWPSSRQVHGTITEFPLFTLWLGDLHPHLLSIPLTLLALTVAHQVGLGGRRLLPALAVAVVVGVSWAASPWSLPATAAAVVLLLWAGDPSWRAPWKFRLGALLGRWSALLPIALAWLLTLPQRHSLPAFGGVGTVHAWTPVSSLLLYAGALLLPAVAVALVASTRGDGAGRLARAGRIGARVAIVVVIGWLLGRPAAVVLAATVLYLGIEAWWHARGELRAVLLLATVGVGLFLVPEVAYVKDAYGADLHRMNTVFKLYIQGWILLAVAAPALLARWLGDRWPRRLVTAALVALGLPHLISVALGSGGNPLAHRGLDGLQWMDRGDRAAVAALRQEPEGAVLIEAVGPAYSEFARLSAASGVPALLGWANHELVWRGARIAPELERREELVRAIYTAGDPERVRQLARAEGVTLIALGALERRQYPGAAIDAVARAGVVVAGLEGTLLVRIGDRVAAQGER